MEPLFRYTPTVTNFAEDVEDAMKPSTRRAWKRRGRQVLKKRYLLFMAACLVAAMISAEFQSSLSAVQAQAPLAAQGTEPETWQQWNIRLGDLLNDLFPPEEQGGNPAFGRTRGVLAGLINQVSSGSIFVSLAAAAGSVLGSESAGILFLILAGAVLLFLFWFLLQNVYPVLLRRAFLEGRIYERVPLQRFLYLLRVKKWLRVSWAMFVRSLLLFLWSLTVVGGVIKRYSYFLVPYILAENPDLSARQAITLSRTMMRGHKWECFLFELSFLGWDILGVLTLGAVSLFYANPYRVASCSEYYVEQRARAIAAGLPGTQALNDRYLYQQAEPSILQAQYADVAAVLDRPPVELDAPTGWKAFLANWFGLLLFPTQKERAYERDQARRLDVRELAAGLEGRAYPTRLFPIPEHSKRSLASSLHYVRHYSVWSLLTLFFSLSFVGWVWEVSMYLVTEGTFANRGSLHGPWLPIYGSGALLILLLLNRLRARPVIHFFSSIVLCGVLEYTASWAMEILSGGMRWWDYSGYFLNLNGRICAEGLLVFGVAGTIVVYVLAPLTDNLVQRIDGKASRTLCLAVLALFVLDVIYSQFVPNTGKGITAEAPGVVYTLDNADRPSQPSSTVSDLLQRKPDPGSLEREIRGPVFFRSHFSHLKYHTGHCRQGDEADGVEFFQRCVLTEDKNDQSQSHCNPVHRETRS